MAAWREAIQGQPDNAVFSVIIGSAAQAGTIRRSLAQGPPARQHGPRLTGPTARSTPSGWPATTYELNRPGSATDRANVTVPGWGSASHGVELTVEPNPAARLTGRKRLPALADRIIADARRGVPEQHGRGCCPCTGSRPASAWSPARDAEGTHGEGSPHRSGRRRPRAAGRHSSSGSPVRPDGSPPAVELAAEAGA